MVDISGRRRARSKPASDDDHSSWLRVNCDVHRCIWAIGASIAIIILALRGGPILIPGSVGTMALSKMLSEPASPTDVK